ncbi:Hvo_1808 family surface protein [Haloarchaeobius sp. DFWS5]|uniref:Hvo_1808 family surface protein n=1 Tax=Haloarchaeobius sp. DFWS5 TaxID=3446114 RepID=UPI003EBDBE87
MRRLATVIVVLMVLLAGCGGTATDDTEDGTTAPTSGDEPTTTDGTDSTGPNGTGGSLADPASDTLGWEAGYWYNESIAVDRSDGLNDSELDKVVARGMARVEQIRKVEFEKTVPVSVISRADYRERLASGNTSTKARLHQNVKWEAVFAVNESADAVAAQRANYGSGVGGFYSPSNEEIVIVSDSDTPEMNEVTLSQELFHALQDQRWNISSFDQSTTELHNARDGIIEGDGNYVDQLYKQRCTANWDCLLPQQQGGQSGGAANINVAMYQVQLQPYSDGVAFVKNIKEQQGWEGVNSVYENPPASTEQTIHPAAYESDQPTDVAIDDTSSNGWHVLDVAGPTDHASFGEAGMFVMLWYPSFEKSQQTGSAQNVVLPYRAHFNIAGQGLDQTDPYNYADEHTAGWDGDRLLPYVKGDASASSETGYVWKSTWDSEQDAKQFADGYQKLLGYHGAESVDGRPNTYRIPDGQEFGDAFSVVQRGDTVVIVNAPSVDALSDVHAGSGTTNDSSVTMDNEDESVGASDYRIAAIAAIAA